MLIILINASVSLYFSEPSPFLATSNKPRVCASLIALTILIISSAISLLEILLKISLTRLSSSNSFVIGRRYLLTAGSINESVKSESTNSSRILTRISTPSSLSSNVMKSMFKSFILTSSRSTNCLYISNMFLIVSISPMLSPSVVQLTFSKIDTFDVPSADVTYKSSTSNKLNLIIAARTKSFLVLSSPNRFSVNKL